MTLLILLELSVVFSTSNSSILMDRLTELRFEGSALRWFFSYLNGQFQKVVLVEITIALAFGVPQDSVLSSILLDICRDLDQGIINMWMTHSSTSPVQLIWVRQWVFGTNAVMD